MSAGELVVLHTRTGGSWNARIVAMHCELVGGAEGKSLEEVEKTF